MTWRYVTSNSIAVIYGRHAYQTYCTLGLCQGRDLKTVFIRIVEAGDKEAAGIEVKMFSDLGRPR